MYHHCHIKKKYLNLAHGEGRYIPKLTYSIGRRTAVSVFLTQYCAGGKIEKNEMGGHVVRMGEVRGVHRVLVGKPEGKRPLGRPRLR